MRNVDIKIAFNGDARVFPMCESFQVLYDMVAKTFNVGQFALKYRDSDGDLITVTSDIELHHAYASSGALFFEVCPLFVATFGHPIAPPSPVVLPAPQSPMAPTAPMMYSPVPQYPPQIPQYPPQQYAVPMQPFPVHPVQQPQVGAPSFNRNDKAELKKFKKEELRAMKEARKAERVQRKVSARNIVPMPMPMHMPMPMPMPMPMSPGAGNVYVGNVPQFALPMTNGAQVPVPVPFPHTITACDAFKRVLMPNVQFTQAWRVRNDGIYAWPAGMMLTFDHSLKHNVGFVLTGPTAVVIERPLAPKEEVVLTFGLVTPNAPGKYVGLWRMSTPDGWRFGKKVKLVVKVPTPENAEKALQKASRKAKLSQDEKAHLKAAKQAAKLAAKQAYWEAKKYVKQGDDKQECREAKKAAKMACREAKKEAKMAHREAKIAHKQAAQAQIRSATSPPRL